MKKRDLKATLLILTLTVVICMCFTSCGMLRFVVDINENTSEATEEMLIPEETNGFMDSTENINDIKTEESGDGSGDDSSDEDKDDTPDEVKPPQNTADNPDEDDKDETPKEITVIENNITVEGVESNVAYAAVSGLRSAVSVYANFTAGSSSGSGVIYELDAETGSAFIITNYHVVYYSNGYYQGSISNDIDIYLFGMEREDYTIPAYYVGGSPNYDIAVLRVENNEILKAAATRGTVKAATIEDSDSIVAGQTAIAIGNAESLGISVTSGIISVTSEYITMMSIDGANQVDFRVIRMDTAVNSGNSGGGLFDDEGKLIGIVNAKITQTDVENIAYAIPTAVACGVADNIIHYCYGTTETRVMKPVIGVTVKATDLTTVYDPTNSTIAVVETVEVNATTIGSLAEGKLFEGDIVKSVTIGEDTVTVTRMYHMIDKLLDARVGDTVKILVTRAGVDKTVEIVITQACLTGY